MDKEELKIHREALQLTQRYLQFALANAATIQDEDDE
jgi:hypothetical protein